MKLFSYSFFEPKQLPDHRTWDKWRTESQRYWFNIPTIALLNKVLYPDYKTKFYLSPNIFNNPLSDVFNIFDIEYEIIQREYSFTEPAIWRMMPLWERNVEIFHARDIDSLTSVNEYKYIKTFENSNCSVGTIRSHENHYNLPCRMLAGLCSFKPNKIPLNIKSFNFDMYYSMKENNYGSDQNLLIKTFTFSEQFTKDNFLDCKIDRQLNKQDFECVEADLNNIKITENIKAIFDKIKQSTNVTWLGEPCDSRGELTNYLLNMNNDIKLKMLKNKNISSFYKVEK
jgi:hypothetical protein